ncbi:hypothetical protein PR202_ga16558 [Eleusine coracana subsp. coracana]|uniref:non-specific serine/threonine protein kinase n=1 Tax=Eleusine coracana subsp. coracana TaxID=191504 RepID=A0AAV5CN30_ELECO|nr:hypothetical protein PR202_ga16558 [Eleusine coracana subsp. coracana]
MVYLAFVDTVQEMSISTVDGASHVRYVMSYSGRIEALSWSRDSSDWTMLTAWPTYECSRYGYCGPSGYCDFNDVTPTCKCLDGFEPVDKGEWRIGQFSKGCHRKEPLRCGDGFLVLPGMQVPDKFVRIGHTDLEECAAECRSNCSCVAYAYANLNSNMSIDDATRCLVWTDDHLVDTQKISAYSNFEADGQETLYLRVGAGSSDILVATNNFSQASMIGKGGFGKVYKGTLEDGREVAIKRLSRDSDQGIEEFTNEVVLIAKLQHRNLVRLLACCVEGDERLLIYEYLPNKSLDATIFNSERNATLDWPMRFNIIKGIAKGLLYLHHDSRLTIVHRDLKASNVLLDTEMKPKIEDFGMARMFGENQENANTRRVVGT